MDEEGTTLEELAALARRGETEAVDRFADERGLRRLVSMQYGELFASATELFFRVDPAMINFETNTDEYEPEVGTVLPRLESAESVGDVRRISLEFRRWFGRLYFDGKRTDELAVDLWSLWQAWKSKTG